MWLACRTATASDLVCLEAESAAEIEAPITIKAGAQPPGASGGAWLEIAEGAGKPPAVAGSARLTFTVDRDGDYLLWCRVWWSDACGNSVAVSINGTKPFLFGQDATYARWHWVKAPPRLPQLTLTAGTHTLQFINREDGIRIDQVLLTRNRRYVPVDLEPISHPPAKAQ
jgi:hypothetical protein